MMRMGQRRHPPPWWPANEPWPMQPGRYRWPAGRARVFRRMAALAMVVLLGGVATAIGLVWTVAARFGIVAGSPAGAIVAQIPSMETEALNQWRFSIVLRDDRSGLLVVRFDPQ